MYDMSDFRNMLQLIMHLCMDYAVFANLHNIVIIFNYLYTISPRMYACVIVWYVKNAIGKPRERIGAANPHQMKFRQTKCFAKKIIKVL